MPRGGPSLPATSVFIREGTARAILDELQQEQVFHGEGEARSRRHVAAFAASLAAHAAIVAAIVIFATPIARTHGEWVLAYLVEGTDGSLGRGGASAAAPQA